MLKSLLDVLLGSEEDKLNDEDEKIALAALCVRVAKSDNVYDSSEISSIDTELSQHFSMSMADAGVLRVQAEKLEQEAPDTCLLYTSPSPRDKRQSRMPSSA